MRFMAPESVPSRSFLSRITPRSGVRMQIAAAATMWLIGASILLVRGVGYMSASKWHAWAVGVGLAVGVLKSRFMLDSVARKAVARIVRRGRACFFGFFSVRSWLLVALMMFGGIAVRDAFAAGRVGAGVLGAVYFAVGTALFLADRVFWHALFRPAEVVSVEGSPGQRDPEPEG